MAITQDNTDAVFSQLESQQDAYLADLLDKGTEFISAETPVDTGLLRSNNQDEVTGPGEGRWFNPTEYAVPVELGHITTSGKHIPANPFFQRGLDRLTQEGEAIAREHFTA